MLSIQLLLESCLCFTSLQLRGHLETPPHLLSLAKDVKLGKYTIPTGNQTPGRRVAESCARILIFHIFSYIVFPEFI